MRDYIYLFAAGLAGIAMGIGGGMAVWRPQLDAMRVQNAALAGELREVRSGLEAELVDLRAQLEARPEAPFAVPAEPVAPDAVEAPGLRLDDAGPDLGALLAPMRAAGEEADRPPADSENNDQAAPSEGEDTERAERRARFEQQREQMREGIRTWLENALANAKSPEEADRISALSEYSEHIGSLMDQMRDAETPEEEEALREQLRGAFGEARDIMQQQQRAMLMEVAAANGITDPQAQKKFVRTINETLESPFFTFGRGGGPGRGMGRRGGGGGGDSGPRGNS